MMRRNTEQINDQFREKPGKLTTVENAHNNADDGETRSHEDYSAIQGQTRQHSTLINLPRKQQICICVNKRNCDTADNKQEESDEISKKMTSWREHPQPA